MQAKSTFPIILAIDTTTEICSLAVQNANGDIVEASHTQSTHHSQAILPLIEQVMNQAQLTLKSLTYIAVTVGPGSFTGVRAGIATAQGLAYGLNIPVIPFGSLDLVALGMADSRHIQVIMDARMQQFYVDSFNWEDNKLVSTQAPNLFSGPELFDSLKKDLALYPNMSFVGTGLALIRDKLQAAFSDFDLILNIDEALNLPQAKNLITYLNTMVSNPNFNLANLAISPMALAPVYVRDQVAHTKK